MRAALLVLVLSGCATPHIDAGSPRSVTVQRTFASDSAAMRVAQEHCQQYGRHARLLDPAAGFGRSIYDCVE